jgi:catechol 2,3-dioxygenase-like lactoylglutathione lyase family enzyme
MKIEFTRLNHVQVCIPPGAENTARDFYGGLLGLKEIPKPEVMRSSGGLWFEIGDIQLHIGIEEPQPPSKRHAAFEVVELARITHYLEEKGVRLRREASIPGANRLSFFDPFGNRIELLEKIAPQAP